MVTPLSRYLKGGLVLCVLAIMLAACGCTGQQPAASPAASPVAGTTAAPVPSDIVTATQPDAGHIVITYAGGPGMEKLIELETTVTDSSGGHRTQSIGSRLATTPITIGGRDTITGSFGGRDHVVVIGWFIDGSRQVMLDTYI